MILLARTASHMMHGGQPLLSLLNVSVDRNYFGSQISSFETDLSVPVLGQQPVHAVFIRAPIVTAVGPAVEVLARLDPPSGHGEIVAVRQDRIIATAFHPELTPDLRWHKLFVSMAREAKLERMRSA